MIKLGETLKRLRRENGLSQERLAVQLGLSRQAVSKWEADLSQPDLDSVARLCEIFSVSADELLGLGPHQGRNTGTKAAAEKGSPRLSTAAKAKILFAAGALACLLAYLLGVLKPASILGTARLLFWQCNYCVTSYWPLYALALILFAAGVYYYGVYVFRE